MIRLKILALLAVALALPGCDLLDRLEGKSPGREAAAWRDSVTLPAALITPPALVVVPVVVPPAPAPMPAAPVCTRNMDGVLTCL